MDSLIFLYDNALIYYPNVFFAVLFLVGILGITLAVIGMVVLGRGIEKFIKAIGYSLRQKKIEERKKTSFVYVIKFLAVSCVRIIRVVFIRINTALGYIESETEKIIKKIEREVFIKE